MGGGKKGGAKVEVELYYMSMHQGVCAGPVDAIRRIVIKEKEAWIGRVTTQQAIYISKEDLFGGPKKEGGVAGTVMYLPGFEDQLMPDGLAVKLGRADGNDCPAYRGLASLFFYGAEGGVTYSNNLGEILWTNLTGGSSGGTGFYWSANVPYLPGIWVEVERAPVGLNPAYAMIPRLGTDTWTTVGTIDLDAKANATGDPLQGTTVGVTLSGFTPTDTIRVTMPAGGNYSAWTYEEGTANKWVNDLDVIPDGDLSESFRWKNSSQVPMVGSHLDGYATPEEARAAFAPHSISGWSSYTFFILDTAPFGGDGTANNDGGLSFMVEQSIGVEDANPAHVIYECLTNTNWGMGSPDTLIDVDSFEAAGVTLYNEGLGVSMIWTRQAAIQDFVQEVLDHAQAVLFVDPSTGLLTLKLIRGDYDPDTLPELNPSNADLANFGRKLWGEIVNEIVVTWTNPENEQDETVTVHDLASITTQGGIVSDSRNYYGVRSAELAQRLAQRDLRSSGAPLATCEAEVDRTQWTLRPASVVKLTWPEYGLLDVVFRVTAIDYGKPGDMGIKLTLIEDVFGLDIGTYTVPPSSIWEDPSAAPNPLDEVQILTLPYFAEVQAGSSVDAEYPDVHAGILGTTDNGDVWSFEVWAEVALTGGGTEWQMITTNTVTSHALLEFDMAAEAESVDITVTDATGQTAPAAGDLALIGEGVDEDTELALITDVTADGYTLQRGALDTVPRAWPAGTSTWFIDIADGAIADGTTRAAGEVVSYKLRTRTSQGLLPLGASTDPFTLSERPWLPLRPANLQVGGVLFNDVTTPVDVTARTDPWVTVSWANRNRLTEDSQILAWSDGTVTPETGQTTTIEVLTADLATMLATHAGLTGASFDIPDASFAGAAPVVYIRAKAERTDDDGTFESLQAHGLWVEVNDTTDGVLSASGTGSFSGTGAGAVGSALSASGTGSLAAVGSTGAFSPVSVAGLEAWYDADAIAQADNTLLNPWPDATGHGWAASTANPGPHLQTNELNGKSIVEFLASGPSSGDGLSMSASLMNGATSGCYFAVFKDALDPPTNQFVAGAVLDAFTNDTGGNRGSHHPFTDSIFYEHFGTDTRKTAGNPASSFSSAYRIYSAHSGAGDYRVYVDGVALFTTATNTVNFGNKARNLGWTAGGLGFLPYVGKIAEVLIYKNDVLSTGDRQKVEGYLAHKWGLTGNLQAGHPYKTTPP